MFLFIAKIYQGGGVFTAEQQAELFFLQMD